MRKKPIQLLVLGYAFFFSAVVFAERTYVYKESDGTVWYTNVKPAAQDSTRFELLEVRGRPTATSSCIGLTKEKMANRAVPYLPTIKQFSSEFHVDAKLIKAVVRNESCFDRSAVSSAGAEGLMQLMPATAKSLGVNDSFDPKQNLRGGIEYLSGLITRYDNNLTLALAAYNAGPGAVQKYDGIPPYPETEKYVERVMNSYRSYVREQLPAETE